MPGAFLVDNIARSLRDRLREETTNAHARVDALFGSCDFASEQGYGAFLFAQGVAWETLRPFLSHGSVARADALRRDLDALDLPRPLPLDGVCLPVEASPGHLYVLEGSRLGSTLLLRELSAKAPALFAKASAYLTESAKVEPWKKLCTGLQKDRDGCDNDGAIIDDALFVFGLFERAWRATDSAKTSIG